MLVDIKTGDKIRVQDVIVLTGIEPVEFIGCWLTRQQLLEELNVPIPVATYLATLSD